jgi:hypothetical protein
MSRRNMTTLYCHSSCFDVAARKSTRMNERCCELTSQVIPDDSPLRTEGFSEVVVVQSRNPVGVRLACFDDLGGHFSQLLSGFGKQRECQSRISVAKQNG